MPNTIDFCGIPLEYVASQPDNAFYMGPDPELLRKYFDNPSAFEYTSIDGYEKAQVRPEDVGGIFLYPHEIEHPENFWSVHCPNGTMGSFREIASHIPALAELKAKGNNMFKAVVDVPSRKCLQVYFTRPLDIPVVDFGSFYLFQTNGRHRLFAAMGMNCRIPVAVVGRMKLK